MQEIQWNTEKLNLKVSMHEVIILQQFDIRHYR